MKEGEGLALGVQAAQMFQSNSSTEKLTRVEVQHVVDATNSTQNELARLGEELENIERRLGVWESCKKHKIALLYGMADSCISKRTALMSL